MPVNAVLAADFTAGDRFAQAREACGMMSLRRRRMVQVKDNGAAIDKFPPPAQMVKPCANVGILARAPAGVIFVKTVHSQDVLAPERHVATDDAALLRVAADDGQRPAHALGGAGDSSG